MASLGNNNNNNSSSSPPIPNRANPKPRNSESADPMRRSFGGNPFPAKPRVNNPSDISRRNSFGSKVELSDKENETKHFLTSKGSKNFMSPTISTVSKINASPRKKVLSDRNGISQSFDDTKTNNQAKSCVSFSDVVHIIGIDDGKKQFEESSYDMTITDFEDKEEILYSDPRFRISPRPSVPYASPEFAAPYDPKNNYLSPRPQFLHYKPNPRIECKHLDELFISESSSSDNELSATENNEEQEKEAEVEAVVEETEDVEEIVCRSIEETTQVEQLIEGEPEAVVVEEEEETGNVEELEAESDQEMVCENTEETTQVPKQFGFTKFKFLGWFFALAMAYFLVSATFSPPTELAILQQSSSYEFHIPNEITEFAKENLDHLSEKLWSFTESSIVYIDKLVSRLGREEQYGPLSFLNLTYTLEDYTVFQPTSVEVSVVAALDHVEEPEEPVQDKIQGENNLEDGHINEYEEESIEEENLEVVCETKDGDSDTDNGFDEQSEMKLEAIVEDGVDLSTEEQRFAEENNDAGGSQSLEKLETGSTKNDQEELEEAESKARGSESQAKLETESTKEELDKAEIEAIYINQHDVESSAINVEQQFQAAESGSEEGFLELKTEEQSVSEVNLEEKNDAPVSQSQEKLETGSTKKDHQEKLEEAESKARGSKSQENLETESTKKDHEELEKTDVEAFYINQHDVESAAINVQEPENGSEEDFVENAAETSDDLDPKARFSNKAGNGLDNATMMIVLSSSVLVLLASVAFLFSKKAKPVAASAPETTEKLKLGHVTEENGMKEKLSSLNFKEEVDDRTSNSFHKKDPKEHQSSSSKLRRESLASSASEYSVGSFSYGSFTTYEKIPIKTGDKEEEMITPVRRSSRLRNHHQSSSGL